MRQQRAGTLAGAVAPSSLRLGGRTRPLLVGAAATVSLILHAGIVLAALDWAGRVDHGAVSEPSDAISVELAATDTTAALKPERLAEPAPAPEATAPVAGSPTPAESTEKAKPLETAEPAEKAEPAPVPDADAPRTRAADLGEPSDVPPEPTAPAAPPAEPPADALPEPPKAQVQGEPAQARPKEPKRVERKVARPEGGVTSKAKAGKGTGSERTSASTGAMLAYADLVRARVAPNRSSETGAVGTAVVSFGLTTSGALAYARIVRSSGNSTNDGIALAVVRGAAPFPPPPSGANPAQLQYTVPYHFQ